MRVAVYYNNYDVRVEERPTPSIGPGEFLMHVRACGICGSDILEWYRIPQAPRVLGHEATGEITEVGESTGGVKVGDRVFVSHHVPCGTCWYCQRGHETACETLHRTNYEPGGFSEYVRVPKLNAERGVYFLPPGLSFEEGTLIEPLACVIRAQRLAGIGGGDTVLVLGSGVSGLLHVMLAKVRGVSRVIATDICEYRKRAAERFGADVVLDGRAEVEKLIRDASGGKPADHVILCTSAPEAAKQALRSVDRGGSVVFFAVPPPAAEIEVPFAGLWRNEIRLITSYGAAPRDLEESLELIAKGTLEVRGLITHRFPLTEIQRAFRLVVEASECLKVVIIP
jgi:L-iditol 2-dehydrogenase